MNEPVVESMTPTTATYGSTITIHGSNLGTKGALTFARPATTVGDEVVIESWSDSQIVARVPFPTAPGPIHIETVDGDCDTKPFTPLTPWTGGDAATLTAVLEAKPLANGGAAVLGLDDAGRVALVEYAGGTATTTVVPGVAASTDDRAPVLARLVIDARGAPVVFATNLLGNVVELASGTTTDSGLTGSVMAAGVDDDGPYVWLLANASFNRARTSAVPFVIDRGPIADVGALDAQVASDGTLVVAHSVDADILFDNEAYLGVARLAPTASEFVLGENAEATPWDDYIAAAHLQISPDSARMFATYSTQEFDETADHPRPPLIRDAGGNWSNPQGLLDGHQPIAYLPTTIAALDGRDGLTLVPDIASAATLLLPLWPAKPAALVLDGTTLRPLIQVGNQVWYPTPPASP
jgi:IPT/TIG domain